MNKDLRIQECIDNHDEYVAILASMSDAALAEKLDTIHLQMELAEQNKNTPAIELLEVWRVQTIEARIYKAENSIPDAPDEIALAIDDIETTAAVTEERKEILNEYMGKTKAFRPKANATEEDRSQLSLF